MPPLLPEQGSLPRTSAEMMVSQHILSVILYSA